MRRILIGAALLGLMAGCTSGGHEAATSSAPPSTSRPPSSSKPASRVPTGPLSVGPVQAVEGECPWISVADASTKEGNRIDKHYVLMAGGKPVGCRFMFWTDDHAVLEITSQRYANHVAAYNAMVRIGQRGANYHGVRNLAPGVDAILYQTTFYAPDGPNDWACTFAKRDTVVTVKTDQDNVEFNARDIAATIAPRF